MTRSSLPVRMPLLDRLFDEAPERAQDAPRSAADTLDGLHQAVRRDLEMLLNARRCWRSPPPAYSELLVSPLAFGIPDCTGAGFGDKRERERLRSEIEATLQRFEPRFTQVTVSLLDNAQSSDATLRLRIEALLRADPAPEAIAFDTVVMPSTNVTVRSVDV